MVQGPIQEYLAGISCSKVSCLGCMERASTMILFTVYISSPATHHVRPKISQTVLSSLLLLLADGGTVCASRYSYHTGQYGRHLGRVLPFSFLTKQSFIHHATRRNNHLSFNVQPWIWSLIHFVNKRFNTKLHTKACLMDKFQKWPNR